MQHCVIPAHAAGDFMSCITRHFTISAKALSDKQGLRIMSQTEPLLCFYRCLSP